EKPTYVGLANTMIAPSTIFAPLIAGWIADFSSYTVTFITAVMFSLLAFITLQLFVKGTMKTSASV
ncbi:MAG: SLC45 family MFS transporter, partial [Leptolinea sp.]|nr:SLC45 family MFS transporter [Leptolinea sp.]